MANFWTGYAWPTVITGIEVIIVVVPLLLVIAMLTYAERKVLAYSQLRKGPNVVGPFGLLQPFADGLKLLVKETIVPSGANRVVFVIAPLLTFTLALVAWAVIPFDYGVVIANINVGILYLFAISSLGVYGIILAGWASNSRYAFLVEYSSMVFALFYLGEYGNMILMSAMTSLLFLGGWLPPFGVTPFTWVPGPIWFALKIAFVLFCFLWVRATFPRFRYDQLMRLGWKVFLPFSLFWLVLTAGVLTAAGWLPQR